MAKAKKSVFFCQNCGHEESKWLGQCPACREWNTFVEEKVTSVKAGTVRDKKEAQIVALSSVETDEDERMMTLINSTFCIGMFIFFLKYKANELTNGGYCKNNRLNLFFSS